MARDGLGNFNLSDPPFVYDTTILEDVMNRVLADIAGGLTQSIPRDGQAAPTAPLPMGGYRHTGVGDATDRNQYAAAGQVQDGVMTWCGAAGGTADALTLMPSPSVPAYAAGQTFRFSASATNTGAVTVVVSGLGVKPIQNAGRVLVAGNIVSGRIYAIDYDGTAFQLSEHSLPSAATETVSGVSRQATIAEAASGTSTTPSALPHVTPEGVAAALVPVKDRTTALETARGRSATVDMAGKAEVIFSSLPPNVRKIRVIVGHAAMPSSATTLAARLITSSGEISSGYTGGVANVGSSGAAINNSGFIALAYQYSGNYLSVVADISRFPDSNLWVWSSSGGFGSVAAATVGGGHVAAGEITGIKLITGGNLIVSGEIFIEWEK